MKIFLVLFSVVCIVQRIFETVLHAKTKGIKKARGTTGLMSFAHAVCFAGAPLECLMIRRVGFGLWFVAGLLLFAGAFLLPRITMFREFYSTRLNHLEGMKSRWRVSMQAIAHRAKEIDMIDEYQYILFRKQISANKYNTQEPLDREIPLEQPQWLLKCWNAFAERRGVVSAGVEDEIGFTLGKVMSLFGRTDTVASSPGRNHEVSSPLSSAHQARRI